MEDYKILGRIGEGAHGIVFKAKHIESGELVALKKVPLRKVEEGIPNTALREIKALQEIEENENIVRLRDVLPHGLGFVLVFDYMLSDLSEVIRNAERPLTEAQVKSYTLMLLKGVEFCHANHIMHRDLKPANLLISATGHLKIADFGLARVFSDKKEGQLYSHQVATRWYRAPELLFGARQYDEGVDLWAVGCIYGEMLNCSPLFPGDTDIGQICCVQRLLGTPSVEKWPALVTFPDYNKITFPHSDPVPFEDMLPDASAIAISLLNRFLVYSSEHRISASKALLHEYFFLDPLPAHHSELPIPPVTGGSRRRGVRRRRTTGGLGGVSDFDVDLPLEDTLIDPASLASIVVDCKR